jgi:leader peptidase (prepilin peptidase)/N-methyltransferase
MPTILQRARDEIAPYRRGVLWAAVPAIAWAVWASGPGWSTPALVVATLAGVVLFAVDAATHRLPDAITFPATGAVGVLLLVAAATTGDWEALLRAVVGGLGLSGVYLLLYKMTRKGVGFGDVKLAILLGGITAWYGWQVLLAGAVLPYLVAGPVALVLMVVGRNGRKTALAFGPYLLVGAALALTLARLVDLG